MKEFSVSIKDIKEAQETLNGIARRTPLIKSFYLTSITGGEVFTKHENMQLTGSFKFRGGYNKVHSLTQEEKDKGVIACSAGNHSQGVALASKLLGVKAKIFMPETAPKAKVAATEGYGAQVIQHGPTFDDCKDGCNIEREKTGETFLHPYDDEKVIAGQGTIGLEILEDMWDVDNVICPIGGGGIISGIAIALKSFNPNIKVIGVQADNVHGMKASFDKGELTEHFTAPTVADGTAVKYPGELTFEIVKELVDEIVTVSEEELELAMKDLMQRCKQVVEGAGALPTAAVLSGKVDKYLPNKKTVLVISGGNVDLKKVSEVCDHFMYQEPEKK
ncbi:MAG: bifunctional threonine ammonia-lyase/L-serine ammonia-lyase TdcB [Mycoplasmatales bacterium]